MKKIRYAMIGVGGYGAKRRASLRKAGCFEMVGGIDLSPSIVAEAEAQEEKPLVAYLSIEALVNDPQVEAVFVCTPAHLHVAQATLAARAGKAIFTEKPLGHDLSDCTALVEYCEEHGIPHGHGFTLRYEPHYQYIKSLLDEGKFGRVVGVSIATMSTLGLIYPPDNWRFHPGENPGGPLYQCGIHKLDLLHFLFGRGEWTAGLAHADITPTQTEDSIVLLGQFAGIPVTFQSHYVASYRHAMEIYGTHATLLVSEHPMRLELKETCWKSGPEPLCNIIDCVPATDATSESLCDFAEAVRERRQPEMNGRHGLWAIESLYEALAVCRPILGETKLKPSENQLREKPLAEQCFA